MRFDEFTQHVSTGLGGNLVDVELTNSDYLFCFKKAKSTYLRMGNAVTRRAFVPILLERGKTVYDLTDTEAEFNIDGVVKVIREQYGISNQDPFGMAIFNDIFSGMYGKESNLLTYELSLQLMERIERYTAQDFDFSYNKSKNVLTLFKKPTQTEEKGFLEVFLYPDQSELYDNLWIQDWAIAEAKGILGRAYRKFNSLSTPTGESGIDGQSLVQESEQEKQRLMEQIENKQDTDTVHGMPIILG